MAMRTPFISREAFDQFVRDGGKPDILFPILDYKFCKYIWDTSPLIASLDEYLQDQPGPKKDLTSPDSVV